MSEYGGFIFIVDEPKRAEMLRTGFDEYRSENFTDVVSAADFRPKEAELFLCSLDGMNLVLAALVRATGRVATGKVRIRFANLVHFEALPLGEIQARLSKRITRFFSLARSGKTIRVSPRTWAAVWETLKQSRPSVATELEHLDKLRRQRPVIVTGSSAPTLAHEKDAAILALRLSGVDPSELLKGVQFEEGFSLFKGIKSVGLIEDQMIKHDASIFKDWELVERTRVGEASFRSDRRVVTIMDVNRTSIENTLGVDLLYYVRPCQTFIMVQYKRMTKEADGVTGYRPDGQCVDEVDRMWKFLGDHPESWDGTPPNYRLSRMPFYLKLCPKETFHPTSQETLKGMYFPLDLWKAICDSPTVKGPKGGVRLTFKNTPTRLNTSEFLLLVGTGLVGSSGATTEDLRKLVRAKVDMDHSVIIAEVDDSETGHDEMQDETPVFDPEEVAGPRSSAEQDDEMDF